MSDSFFSLQWKSYIDPTLAVGLGRPRPGTKIKKFVPQSLSGQSPKESSEIIIKYWPNVLMFGQPVVSPPEN